jgi:hypothetical protein
MDMEKGDLIVCDVDTGVDTGTAQKSGANTRSKIISYLFEQCPDLHQLDGEHTSQTIREIFGRLKGRYMTVKGHVQSGKTKFMICASTLFLVCGYSVVIVLRNNKADQEQIHERLVLFEKEMNKAISSSKRTFNVCRTSSQAVTVEQNKPRIYLTLGNSSSTLKMLKGLTEQVDMGKGIALFIDEVDFVDSCDGTHKSEVIPLLKQHSHCIFGVSATIMDPLGKENVYPDDVILLSMSPHYKGIPSIQVVEIDTSAVYTGKTSANLFETDEGLMDFAKMFSGQKPFTFANGVVHPHICLVNICRTKGPTVAAQVKLSRKFPDMVVVVYNGDGITYAYKKKMSEYKGTISSMLQMMKDRFESEKVVPNILIFSGDLAGRGISFTSSDFKWHLTSMRLLVANQCDEPELIQRVRLCGVYHDDVPLTLYSTSEILYDIRKAYFRQEEIICNLKKKKDEKEGEKGEEDDGDDGEEKQLCKQFIESLSITKDKFTRRSPVKDKDGTEFHFKKVDKEVGWDLDVYLSRQLPPDQAYKMYGIDAPTTKEREDFKEQFASDEEEDEDEEDEPDIFMIVKDDIVNPKYIGIYDAIVTYLKKCGKGKWVSRGNIREACRDTIQDAREMGQLQGRYSVGYDGGDGEAGEDTMIWQKVGREYEYKLT